MTRPENRLEIVHVAEASFAGVGRHVLDLVEQQLVAGHSVSLVWSRGRASETFLRRSNQLRESSGLRVIEAAMTSHPSVKNVTATRRVRSSAIEASADIIHGHSTGGGMVARAAALGTSAQSVFTPNAYFSLSPFATGLQRTTYLLLERLLARITGGLIVVSAEELAHAEVHHLTAKSTHVVANGCTIESADPPTAIVQQRRASNSPVIGFVGRMDAQKRPRLLTDAYRSLLDNELAHLETDDLPRLFFVGDGPEATFVEDHISRTLANEYGALATMFGEVDGASSMQAFDVLAVPSAYEGFPYVVLEALSAGIPVAATPSVPLTAFGQAPAGITVSVDDSPAEFAAAIAAAMSANWSPSEIRASAEPFTIERMASETETVYRSVLSDRRPVK